MHSDSTIIEDLDPEVAEQLASRRDVLRRSGLAAAAISAPVALGLMARDAFAQDGGALPQEVVDVLNFALTLEYLEAAYYKTGLESDGLLSGDAEKTFTVFSEHEDAHVKFLEEALGDKAVKEPKFDFTAGGAFAPFEDLKTFMLLSQAFEDTGQRAYRGQAGALAGNPDILTAALTIHSVEARHAAQVRRMRGISPWVPEDQPDAPKAIAAVYAGQDVTEKYGVDVPAVSTVGPVQVTEAFDEPLTKEAVLKIVKPFLAG
ncbi:MAG: ferritin-like domain-containing protein [Solirubrobacterales bacterium]|nr:ferritin-like domain-containing protein [Solirubrobacterales bacterium]